MTPCYTWHWHSVFTPAHGIYTGTCHAIFDTWHPTPVLAMLYLTHDTRHRNLPCYIRHLILDPGTWYMTHLSPDPDPRYVTHVNPYLICYKYIDLTSWPLTGHYHPWYPYYMTYSWLSLLWGVDMVIILLPDIWYSWTPVLLNSCKLEPMK